MMFRMPARSGSRAPTYVEKAFQTAVADPLYTVEEAALLAEAAEIVNRAGEGGAFDDLTQQTDPLARMHFAAEKAQELLPVGVVAVARETVFGPRILVGLKGRLG